MREEIGSEFWDIPINNKKNVYFKNASWYVSGRAALRSILKDIAKKEKYIKAALPSYLCESMILPFLIEKIEFKFYQIEILNGKLICNYENIDDCNVILILDYFGYDSLSMNFNDSKKIIIRDLTHSIFNKKFDDADYYFGSLRKWTGFMTGGFAINLKNQKYCDELLIDNYIFYREAAMKQKKKYIEEVINDKIYLDLFKRAEDLLEKCYILKSTDFDIDCANYLNIEYIKKRRRENAQVLIDGLKDLCIVKSISKNDCPLCVPIFTHHRDALRNYLISKDIFCPVHWPKPKCLNDDFSFDLYNYELSLVCDQRYGKEDMERIILEVKRFMESDYNA